MTASLARAAARGTVYTLSAQGAKILLQLGSIAILARLLTPNDYGLVALVMVVVGAGEIFRDFGLTSASIQAESVSRQERSQLFWANTLIGAVLGILVFVASWPAGLVTGRPEIVAITQALALLFVINGLLTQFRASLLRDLRFKALAVIDISTAAVALGAAILAAVWGAGYWALVIQQLLGVTLSLVLYAAVAGWLPAWPTRKVSIRRFLRFGGNMVATGFIGYLSSQFDTALVGLRFGTTSLGLYNRSFQLIMTPLNQIRVPLGSVVQPVFARAQTDVVRFNRYVVAVQLALGYGLGIPLATVAALAAPIVNIMLGDQWSGAAPLLACFAAAALMSQLAMVGYWVYVSRNLVHQLFRYSLISLAIKIVCILVGSLGGPTGVAIGVAVAPALSWPLSLWWLNRITTVPVRPLYAGAARILILNGLVFGVAALTTWAIPSSVSPLIHLAAGIAAALVVAGAALSVRAYRRDLRILLTAVSAIRRDRTPATASEPVAQRG